MSFQFAESRKVGQRGRVQLPDSFRDELELSEGDEVTIRLVNDSLVVDKKGQESDLRQHSNESEDFVLKDRLMFSLLYKILEQGADEEGLSEHLEEQKKAIENGYKYHYEDIRSPVFEGISGELPSHECEFVWRVLEMFDSLTLSYENLSDEEKEECDFSETRVHFYGFDGNNEVQYLSYAKYILEDMKRFTPICRTVDGYNSHRKVASKYRQMLEVWKKYSVEEKYELSPSQLKEIVSA